MNASVSLVRGPVAATYPSHSRCATCAADSAVPPLPPLLLLRLLLLVVVVVVVVVGLAARGRAAGVLAVAVLLVRVGVEVRLLVGGVGVGRFGAILWERWWWW
jgi:hypothetical protein